MLDTAVERTVVLAAVALWFAHGWYLNTRLERVHSKLDRLMSAFDGLRDYLYEIDPQFDDERGLIEDVEQCLERGTMTLAGASHMDLMKEKKATGRRTLNTPFVT